MGSTEAHVGGAKSRRSEVTVCRVAALAGITGAILTQAALLIGAYLVLIDELTASSLISVVSTAAAGGMLMLGTRRVAVRTSRRDAILATPSVRLVGGTDAGTGGDPHKSAA